MTPARIAELRASRLRGELARICHAADQALKETPDE